MSNEYYQAGSTPAPNSPGASATMRGQFTAIALAFDKLPTMAGSADEFVLINPTGTALIASGFKFTDFVTPSGVQTLTNKTLAWADNTWAGFGTGATKNAGTGADEVLLLAEANKLPALDGSLLTTDTAPTGDSSSRIASTKFVAETVTAIGGAVPSNATPLMSGVASPGAAGLVSRDDHVHPTDISRAPASAGTAAGTSYVAGGGIIATNVQAAIQELDSDKAPASAGTAAGTSYVAGGGIIATNVQAAIQELDSDKAPASAGTAAGTSYVAGGGIIATNVQAAIQELDSEKAPIASPSFTGTVTAPQNFNASGAYGALQVGATDVMRFGADNSGQLAGFRNRIINGDMRISQRGPGLFTAASAFTLDRWKFDTDGTFSVSQNQRYADQRFQLTLTCHGTSYAYLRQPVEGVDTLANKTATLSFEIEAPDGTTVTPRLVQVFGTGGSTPVETVGTPIVVVPGRTKYSKTFTLPSIAGKTIAGGNDCLMCDLLFGTQIISGVLLYNVQLEEGSIATPFEQRPIGLELSLCQRYYELGNEKQWSYGLAGVPQGGCRIFAVKKRTNPQIAILNPNLVNCAGLTNEGSGLGEFRYYATVSSTASVVMTFDWTASAEL